MELFQENNPLKELPLAENKLYNLIEVEEGKYSITSKETKALKESLGTTEEETKTVEALLAGPARHARLTQMQKDMLVALQSEGDSNQKAKKALRVLGGAENRLHQSVSVSEFTQLHNIIAQMLSGLTTDTVGRAGWDVEPRSKVYIKGLYDRVKSLTGAGFVIRSKGAVLGVQSKVRDDLTIGE